MSGETVVVTGTLRADGTLDLDERPGLAPGPVRVVIAPVSSPALGQPRRTILDVLGEIQSRQAARGFRGRSLQEMEADEARRRAEDEEYDERWRTIWNQTIPSPPGDSDG